jgi:hypothetical protein
VEVIWDIRILLGTVCAGGMEWSAKEAGAGNAGGSWAGKRAQNLIKRGRKLCFRGKKARRKWKCNVKVISSVKAYIDSAGVMQGLNAYSGPCGHLIPFEVGTSFCLMWAAIPL